MTDRARRIGPLDDAELLARLPGGFPPRNTKLAPAKWRRAAELFAISNGDVRLRNICAECDVSHRTAWRMREALRDSLQILNEQALRAPA